MMLALGAVSSALDLLNSLTQSKPADKAAGFGATRSGFDPASVVAPAPAAGSGFVTQSGGLSPSTLSAVLAALDKSSAAAAPALSSSGASDPIKGLFGQLDADRDGKVSRAEFQAGLGAGGSNAATAGSVFGKLDSNADGSVSLDELSAALKPTEKHHRHGGKWNGSSADPLLQALAGAPGTAASDGDGSAAASSSRSDKSRVWQPSAASASSDAASSYNFIDHLVQNQDKARTAAAPTVSFTA